MHIHLGQSDGYLKSIELTRVSHHKALPHLCQLIRTNKNGHFHTLNKICVENSVLNDKDYVALEDIFHHSHDLHEVTLHANHIDLGHLIELFSALPGDKLTSISLTDNWIGEKISNDFFEFLTHQSALNHIDFSLNWLGDKGVIALLESIHKNLQQLQLSCNDFHLEGMKAIRQFILQCQHVSELDISYNRLDAKAAEQIASIISESDTISSIKANSNQMSDQGAELIADAMKPNTKLAFLDVSDNGITCQGAKHLIERALATRQIKRLDLRHNALNREDIKPSQGWGTALEVLV
jgi:Ran GTPase-activating protein (RanGAP) involved in mRNA processing and transport